MWLVHAALYIYILHKEGILFDFVECILLDCLLHEKFCCISLCCYIAKCMSEKGSTG